MHECSLETMVVDSEDWPDTIESNVTLHPGQKHFAGPSTTAVPPYDRGIPYVLRTLRGLTLERISYVFS